jgi:hypothetical protein
MDVLCFPPSPTLGGAAYWCIHIYIYTHIHIDAYVHTCMSAYIHMCIRAYDALNVTWPNITNE